MPASLCPAPLLRWGDDLGGNLAGDLGGDLSGDLGGEVAGEVAITGCARRALLTARLIIAFAWSV